ncbi:hypothetical protein ABZ570_13985 [Micromonospora sp. NPDC007271]|uniref:hypothetical protein n=1 Tax=Micromonospora sp. NPDC007271 TaxID=3154587 RepID=UPI0033D83FE6
MAVAALITSIVAVLVAGTSAAFTFWNARVNAARWRKDRTPRFDADIEDRRSWYRLRLKLTSAESVSSVTVTLMEGHGVSFTTSQKGVDPMSTLPVRTATHGALQTGEVATWRVDLDEDRANKVTVRIASQGTNRRDRWTQLVELDVPVNVLKTVL